MAAATATATTLVSEQVGNSSLYVLSVVVVGDYATGGIALDLGSNESLATVVLTAPGYVCHWDRDNQKIVLYRQKDPAAAGGADIALPEVGNGTTLSSMTLRGIAVGQ